MQIAPTVHFISIEVGVVLYIRRTNNLINQFNVYFTKTVHLASLFAQYTHKQTSLRDALIYNANTCIYHNTLISVQYWYMNYFTLYCSVLNTQQLLSPSFLSKYPWRPILVSRMARLILFSIFANVLCKYEYILYYKEPFSSIMCCTTVQQVGQ